MKYKYLIMVVGDSNNNKYYEMIENDNLTFDVKYGRVGNNPQHQSYPMSKWESTYKSKIRKGYVDITNKVSQVKSKSKYKEISDSVIAGIISFLLTESNNNVADNYLVKSENVTKAQIDESQSILDSISNMLHCSFLTEDKINNINKKLQQLYSIIPRKMKHVSDYLLSCSDINKAKRLILSEQDNLDSMSASVSMNTELDDNTEEKTILDVLDINIERITNEEEQYIKNALGSIKDKYHQAVRVIHNKSKQKFEEHIAKVDNKKIELLWHGSRNANWISILQTGLLIRPSGAIHTGSMFGDGIYFANKARKSYGYTSGNGSYWANGNSNKAFMALFEIHTGHTYHINKHTSECYKFSESYIKNKNNYDSVFAHGGIDLKNDEKIVYNSNQCTIKYLVELHS